MANKAFQRTYTQLEAITKATVTLKADESITIPGLVHGVGYTVEEINLQPGFTQISPVNSAAATGTIQAGSAATAAFINTYSTSKLTISKDGMSKKAKYIIFKLFLYIFFV